MKYYYVVWEDVYCECERGEAIEGNPYVLAEENDYIISFLREITEQEYSEVKTAEKKIKKKREIEIAEEKAKKQKWQEAHNKLPWYKKMFDL